MASSIPPLQLLITGDNSDAVKKLLEVKQRADETAKAAVKAANEATAAERQARQEYEASRRAYTSADAAAKQAAKGRMDAAKGAYDAARQEAQGLREVAKEANGIRSDAVKELNGALKDAAEEYRDVQRAAESAGRAQKKAAEDATRAQKQHREELAATAQRYGQVAQSIPGGNVVGAAMGGRAGMRQQFGDVNKAMVMAGDGGPMDTGVLNRGAMSADALNDSLTGLRNVGIATTVASVGLHRVAESWRKMGADAVESENLFEVSFGNSANSVRAWSENLQNTLGLNGYEVRKQAGVFNTMFDSMKIGAPEANKMSKSLTELANDMASFYNMSPDEAFTKLRSGIVGETEPLRSVGVVLLENTTKEYAYANGIAKRGEELTEIQKVQARYGQIMEQSAKAQGDLARTMESPENTRRRADAMRDLAQIEFGKGSAAAAADIDNLKMSVLGVIGANSTVAQSFGWIAYMGSELGMGVGALTAFGASLSQLYLAYITLKTEAGVRANLKASAEAADTAATAINTTAQTANTAATGGATTATSLDTTATEIATGATLEEATAKDIESLAEGKNAEATAGNTAQKVVNTEATVANTAAQGLGARALGYVAIAGTAAGAAVGAISVGAALALSAVAYSCAQSIGWIDKEQGFVDRLAAGWKNVRDRATGNNAQWEQNQTDLTTEIEKVKTRNASEVLNGKKTQAQADENNRSEEIRLREQFAREQQRIGDKEHMVANQQAAANLRAQQNITVNMPVVPAATPTATPASSGTRIVPLSAQSAAPAPMTATVGAFTPSDAGGFDAESAIAQLQNQKAALTGKVNAEARKQIDRQIRSLRLSQKRQNAVESAQRKADKARRSLAAKEEKAAEKEESQASKDAADIANIERDNADSEREYQLRKQIQMAKDEGDAATVRRLTRQLELIKADAKRKDELAKAALEKDPAHRAALEREAQLHYRGAFAMAGHVADDAAEDANGGNKHDERLRAAMSLSRMKGRGIEHINFGNMNGVLNGGNSGGGFGRRGSGDASVTADYKVTQNARGGRKLKIIVPEVDLGDDDFADLEVRR